VLWCQCVILERNYEWITIWIEELRNSDETQHWFNFFFSNTSYS
jgi:hypothetical protein